MRITYIERTKSFFEFLLRVFAILGGMYGIVRVCFAAISSFISLRSKEAAQSFNDIFA